MVHYLKITNFGPIKDEVTINFEVVEELSDSVYEVVMPDGRRLLKLAYIYGANASGKTTVLKAFEFLRKILLKPIHDKAIPLEFEPFLFTGDPYLNSTKFALSFYADGICYVYELECNKENILSEALVFYKSAKPTEFFTRKTDLGKRLARIKFGNKIKISSRDKDLLESNTLHNNTVIGAYNKTNVDIPELEKLNRWLNAFLIGMLTSVNDLTEATASMINKDPAIKKWIDAFLNKADNQIAEIKVGDDDDYVSGPLPDYLIDNVANRFRSQGSYKIKTSIRPLKEDIGPVKNDSQTGPVRASDALLRVRPQKFYGGGTIERRIDFVHKMINDNSYSLPISAESSGTKRYFGLGGPLYQLIHNAHLLCIDELETSLHPDLMVYFLQAFLLNSKKSQLLITTHNISLMENQDFVRRDALWFSEKKDNGSVDLYSAADFNSDLLRKGASIINAYKTGKLGAKPNLGSPYLAEE